MGLDFFVLENSITTSMASLASTPDTVFLLLYVCRIIPTPWGLCLKTIDEELRSVTARPNSNEENLPRNMTETHQHIRDDQGRSEF